MIIEIRKGKHYDDSGINELVLTCTTVGGQSVAEFNPGTVSNPWIDISLDVDRAEDDDIPLTVLFREGANGLVREKGSTSSIGVVGQSKILIDDWLFGTPCSELNFWEARITDNNGVVFDEFEIRPDNVEKSQYDPQCALNFTLKESNKSRNWLVRTSIMDDWLGLFSETRDFHTVEVCVHNSPFQHGLNVGLMMFIQGFGSITLPGIGTIGLSTLIQATGLIDFGEEISDAMGFGSYMPCPLISEILDNMCGKHSWTCVSPFHTGDLDMDAIFAPYAGDFNKNPDSCISDYEKFKFNNVTVKSCKDFVEALCNVYNMDYEMKTSTQELIFTFNKDKNASPVVLPLNEPDVLDHKKIFQPKKRYASTEFGYEMDTGDQKSNTMQKVYNETVSNTNNVANPLFEGIDRKKTDFSPLGFWGDGFGTNYLSEIPLKGSLICIVLYAALLFIAIIGAVPHVGTGITTNPAFIVLALILGAGITNALVFAVNIQSDYAYDSCHEGAVHLYGTGQKSNLSIIRLESGRALNDAKVVSIDVGNIVENPKYNPSADPWDNQWSNAAGYGRTKAFNYPLYYDPKYFGNLYDTYYEQTQNISYRNASNSLQEVTIVACKDYLEFFGFNDEGKRREGKVIEWVYKGITYVAQISEVEYNSNEQTIIFTGKLFR